VIEQVTRRLVVFDSHDLDVLAQGDSGEGGKRVNFLELLEVVGTAQ